MTDSPDDRRVNLRLAPNAEAAFAANVCDCAIDAVALPLNVNGATRLLCQRCFRLRPTLDAEPSTTADEHTERVRDRFPEGATPTEPVVTDRGFRHLPPVSSTYGGHARVYESSAALGPHVWLACVAPSQLNDPASPAVETHLHLTLAGAAALRDQLDYLVQHHYQVRTGADDDDEDTS